MKDNPDTNELSYKNSDDRKEMTVRIRLMLHAVIQHGCTAVVLSAFGCGTMAHPVEEVAMIFKSEMWKVGSFLPFVYFAISDNYCEPGYGNFEIFLKVMVRSWSDVWCIPISQTFSTETIESSIVTQGGSPGGLERI